MLRSFVEAPKSHAKNFLFCWQKGVVVLILSPRKRAGPEAFRTTHARIAQLVEHNLAKVGVASSNLVSRSSKASHFGGLFLCHYLEFQLSFA